jgi:hypothetical protein
LKSSIPSDATLSILPSHRDEFIRSVLRNMYAAESDGLARKNIRARIGITGKGVAPNYRVESTELMTIDPVTICGIVFNFHNTGLYKTFRGTTHEEMAHLDDFESHDENWSSQAMTFSDVETFLHIVNN